MMPLLFRNWVKHIEPCSEHSTVIIQTRHIPNMNHFVSYIQACTSDYSVCVSSCEPKVPEYIRYM